MERLESVLPHLDFVSLALETNFVHELADQVNAPPVAGIKVFLPCGIGKNVRIKTRSGISHCNYKSSVGIRLQPALNLFCRVTLASVDHGIDQGFLNRQTDLQSLLLRNPQFDQSFGYSIRSGTDRIQIRPETNVEQFG